MFPLYRGYRLGRESISIQRTRNYYMIQEFFEHENSNVMGGPVAVSLTRKMKQSN